MIEREETGTVLQFPTKYRPDGQLSESWITSKALAMHLGVSESTIKRWRQEGLPCQKFPGRLVRYKRSRVEAWLRGG